MQVDLKSQRNDLSIHILILIASYLVLKQKINEFKKEIHKDKDNSSTKTFYVRSRNKNNSFLMF